MHSLVSCGVSGVPSAIFFACAASDVGEICPQDRPTWQQAIGRGSDGWPRAFQLPGSSNQKRCQDAERVGVQDSSQEDLFV